MLSLVGSTRLLCFWSFLLPLLLLSFGPSPSKADLHWIWLSCLCEFDQAGCFEWAFPPCIRMAIDQRISLRRPCSTLGWEIASSSSVNSWILVYGELCVLPVARLSSNSCSDFLLLYSAKSDSYLAQASLCCLARHRHPCFSLFLLSLACFWLSVSLLCPWAKVIYWILIHLKIWHRALLEGLVLIRDDESWILLEHELHHCSR
jgi:hypothetical protein